MFTFIGLAVAWVIGLTILGSIYNTSRVQRGEQINDGTTAVIQAFSFGPVAILGALSPEARSAGKTPYMLMGGIGGTIGFYLLYQSI